MYESNQTHAASDVTDKQVRPGAGTAGSLPTVGSTPVVIEDVQALHTALQARWFAAGQPSGELAGGALPGLWLCLQKQQLPTANLLLAGLDRLNAYIERGEQATTAEQALIDKFDPSNTSALHVWAFLLEHHHDARLKDYATLCEGVAQEAAQVNRLRNASGTGTMHLLPYVHRLVPLLESGRWAVFFDPIPLNDNGCPLHDSVIRIAEVSPTGKSVLLESEFNHRSKRVRPAQIAGTFASEEEAKQAVQFSLVTAHMLDLVNATRTARLVQMLNAGQATSVHRTAPRTQIQ